MPRGNRRVGLSFRYIHHFAPSAIDKLLFAGLNALLPSVSDALQRSKGGSTPPLLGLSGEGSISSSAKNFRRIQITSHPVETGQAPLI